MPAERTRNVLQAGAFLRELAASKAVPKSIREEAYRLLRHYPTVSDIEAIALHEERLRELTQSAFVRPYLSSQIEPEWFRGYSLGPHRI
ncbi:BPSL0761 family protein [Pseudoxanthomonas mexicana]